MTVYLILALSTLAATGKALFCKVIGVGGHSERQALLLNCRAFFVAFACALLFLLTDLGGTPSLSAFSLLLSLLFGFSVAATQILQAKAMGSGPASLVTLIYSCGFLLPIFWGLVFWQEEVSLFQWLGIALLPAVLALVIERRGEGAHPRRWLLLALLAMLGSGANAILQKTHQHSAFAAELPLFLACSLLFSAIFTGLAALLVRERAQTPPVKARGAVWVPICLGVCVGALNFLNLYLAGRLPSVIHFPVYNIGSLLLTSMLSALLYRDKPGKRQTAGFLVGIVAILIIGLL